MSDPSESPNALDLAQLRQAVHASGEVIFMTNREGVFTFVNPQFERLYGYSAADVVGRTTPRILKGDGLSPEHYARFWQELGLGLVVRGEFVNLARDGTLLTVEATVNPIWDHANAVVGFLAIQHDITDRKRAEAALRQSDARLRNLTDNVLDLISHVTLDGTYVFATPSHATVLGYAPASLVGTSAFALVHPEDQARMRAIIDDAVQHRTPARLQVRCRHADGHDVWLEIVASLLADERHAPTGAILSARDLTERKQLEDQFRQAQKMEAVGQLAGGIAHDFNNVLTAILGYSDLALERAAPDSELASDLRAIKAAGERAGRLTRQLLAFSRKQIAQPRVLDLNHVVEDVQKMLGRVIGEDVSLVIRPAPALGRIKADPTHIEQLLMNLAVNARDAMAKGGTLTISTANAELDAEFAGRHAGAQPGSYVVVAVEDTGHGIPAEILEHVFEPFFTTKPVGKGTGLGLSMVYGIVKQSGGYVTIDSAHGVGTTVRSYFPQVDDPVTPVHASHAAAQSLRGCETILLAEDEGPIRALVARQLARLGYVILPARDGAEAAALEASHEGPIDLLISDLIMPGLNGPDLAQHLVRRRPHLKVLFVSGFSSHATISAGNIGARNAFLQKPFTLDRLAQKVREVLDLPSDHPAGPSGTR